MSISLPYTHRSTVANNILSSWHFYLFIWRTDIALLLLWNVESLRKSSLFFTKKISIVFRLPLSYIYSSFFYSSRLEYINASSSKFYYIIWYFRRFLMAFGFPERLFPRGKYDAHRMRVFALAISWISIVYNGIEGGVSIGLGAEVVSRALIVFGIQSLVEVLSAALVIYRFRKELQDNSPANLSLERRATLGIGILFILLTIGTWVASIVALVTHAEPESSKASLIVSAASLVFMIFIWLPKPWIAIELNSSVMRGEAACSLACIYLTIVLFVGSLVYKLWHGGWWIDSAVAMLLGCFFLHEGWQMIAWARNKNFNGGCCKTCSAPPAVTSIVNNAAVADTCKGGCPQTCSAAPPVLTSTNDTATSPVESRTTQKCECCLNNIECIKNGTCVCKLSSAGKTSTDINVFCLGASKCCAYGGIMCLSI